MKNKIVKITFLLMFCVILGSTIYATTFNISGASSGEPNSKVTITISGDFVGRVNLSVSNGTLSASKVWIENNSQTVTVTLGESGTTSITATPFKVSNQEGEIISVNEKNKSISIKKKETTTNTTTNKNNTTTNTTTNKNNTNKNNTTTTTKKSSNANLSKITLGVEGLSFNKSQTTYNVKVGEDVDKLTMSVTTEDSKATYTITGNKDFKAGVNVVKIIVTAEDGTTKTYKINVEKEGNIEESSSALVNLIIENMKFTEDFNKTVTEYIGSNMKYTEKLNILPYTEAEEATYEIIGNENLKEGENEIIIKVTSKDKSTTTEYKVKFNMLSLEETNNMVSSENVNIYAENNKADDTNWQAELWNTVKENATIILLYFLALIEFLQVVYLYTKLKEVNPDEVTIKRRKKNK